MATYRVSMVLAKDKTHDPSTFIDHATRFAGCSSEESARTKARIIYGERIVTIKSVKPDDA